MTLGKPMSFVYGHENDVTQKHRSRLSRTNEGRGVEGWTGGA